MFPSEDIARALSDLEKRIERLERLDQVFTINATETVINEAGIDRDLRIEGVGRPNLVVVDAGAGTVRLDGDLIFVGAQSITTTAGVLTINPFINLLISTGTILLTGAGAFAITPNTADGFDNRRVGVGGGGAIDLARGAYFLLHGNERVGVPGQAWLVAGLGSYVVLDNRVFVGPSGTAPSATLHVDQDSPTGAEPVLLLDQADVSEEMIEFVTTIGVGNAIEAVGAKTLTTTHFVKVTLPGGLTRYFPVGTIA